MNDLLVFLLGFFTCAVGVLLALLFDVSFTSLEDWIKQYIQDRKR